MSTVKCPYCGSSNLQDLGKPNDNNTFIDKILNFAESFSGKNEHNYKCLKCKRVFTADKKSLF